MTDATLSALPLYKGDTWTINVQLTNPDGTPANLTGSVGYGSLLTGEGEGEQITSVTNLPQTDARPLAAGWFIFRIEGDVTQNVPGDPPNPTAFLTRLRVAQLDSSNALVTRGVVPINVKVA